MPSMEIIKALTSRAFKRQHGGIPCKKPHVLCHASYFRGRRRRAQHGAAEQLRLILPSSDHRHQVWAMRFRFKSKRSR